ncbi:MAG TPA: hypothetical protein VF843_03235 [Streptosporangiaceae bacterium]
MDAAGVCCERCPEATLANTRHIARRRRLKAAVFHPQAASAYETEFTNDQELPAPASLTSTDNGQREELRIPRQAGPRHETVVALGHGHHHPHGPRYAPAAAYAGANLYRAVTGEIIDASPQVIVIGEGTGERRFALTADTRAWRGGPLDPAALDRGDLATIRLLPHRPGVADRIWANIGRVTGTIVGRDGDRLLVAESRTTPPQAVIIPVHARVKVQVRYPNLQRGYLLDIIGLRRDGYLEGLVPANPQPNYRSDLVQKDNQLPGRMSDSIAGSATWHDFAAEPYGVLGVSYPAIDPAASCREDLLAGYPPGAAPAFRDLPYLAVGTALTVRNECTGITCTLPVTGCAPMARLFNDRCVACANSPRGRVADLTIASFVALGGELDDGCFSTTLTIGR